MQDLFDGDKEYKECQVLSPYQIPTAIGLDKKYGDFKFQAKGGKGGGKGKGGRAPGNDHGGRGGLGSTDEPGAKRTRTEQQQDDEVMGGGSVRGIPPPMLPPTPGLGMGGGGGLGFQQAPSSPTYAAAPPPAEDASEPLAVKGVTKKTIAQLMMEKMGWKAGDGLGKLHQGRTEAVITTEKLDKTGVGFEYDTGAIQQRRHTVDSNKVVDLSPHVEWICAGNVDIDPETEGATQWEPAGGWRSGMIHAAIDGSSVTNYDVHCSRPVVEKMFFTKNKFNTVNRELFTSARTRSNPYELLKSHFFMNRAALKMAEIDMMMGLFPTLCQGWGEKQPGGCKGLLAGEKGTTLHFGDVCAGPGGFSEYCMWRSWRISQLKPELGMDRAEAWGFTLAGNDDFKVEKFNQDAPHNTFNACYGPDNSGNIFIGVNLKSFEHDVNRGTEGVGLALLMGDGGFSVEGEENLQELHMKQLILCQFLAGLMNIKVGGIFVCKIFDCFTPFTVGLLSIIYRQFADFAIIKPVTSRPANSERYVIARGKWLRRPPVVDYLLAVNEELNAKPKRDVVEVIANTEMTEEFKRYMKASSIDIGEKQIDGLEELIKYMEDKNLAPLDQIAVREQCLDLWDVPREQKKKFGYAGDRNVKWPPSAAEQRAALAAAVPVSTVVLGEEGSTSSPKIPKKAGARRRAKPAESGDFVLSAAALAAAAAAKAL